jgi:hypothetical protein
MAHIGAHNEMLSWLRELRKIHDGEAGINRSPRRPLPRFEFVVIRGDSWLGWDSTFNHI